MCRSARRTCRSARQSTLAGVLSAGIYLHMTRLPVPIPVPVRHATNSPIPVGTPTPDCKRKQCGK